MLFSLESLKFWLKPEIQNEKIQLAAQAEKIKGLNEKSTKICTTRTKQPKKV